MEIVVSVYCVIVFVNHPDGGETAFIQTLLYLIYATLALSFMRVSARCLFRQDKSLRKKIIELNIYFSGFTLCFVFFPRRSHWLPRN